MTAGHSNVGLAWHALTFPWRYAWRALARWQRGAHEDVTHPAWWPSWLGERRGIASPHEGKSVVIFDSGQRFEFTPAAWGSYRGHVYHGINRPDAPDILRRLARLGLPTDSAAILAAVSSFEGGYDAIQTFDRGKFSWGFIQFAATGGLPRLLDAMKRQWPATFHTCFTRAGIDVRDGRLVIASNGRTYTGRHAADQLHDQPLLWMAFLRSSHREDVKDAQVMAAYQAYYAHPLTLTVRLGAHEIALGDLYANDLVARGFICDRAVHHGVGHLRLLFTKAVRHVRASSTADADAILRTAWTFELVDDARITRLDSTLRAEAAATPARIAPPAAR